MATISTSTSEKVISIKQFLGLNENPDGDNKLKTGEATVCRNFKVTNSGNLMKRYGTTLKYSLGDAPVMGMWHGWCTKHELAIAACDSHLWMLMDNDWLVNPSDLGSITTTEDVFMFGFDEKVYVMTGHEYCEISSQDVPIASAVSATVSASGITAASVNKVTWETKINTTGKYTLVYLDSDAVATAIIETGDISDATVDIDTFETQITEAGLYTFLYDGTNEVWKFGPDWGLTVDLGDYGVSYDGTAGDGDKIEVAYLAEGWYMSQQEIDLTEYGITVTGTAQLGDAIVVNYTAAYIEVQWTMQNLTDGTHGYRPLVATNISPSGGGSLLEEVNKMNGQRRVWINGDGSGKTFTMPETFHAVDKIIDLRTQDVVPQTDYSWTEDTNTVTFNTAPAQAENVYEIQYSVSTNFSSTIAAMRYAEMYAGTQDTRVFIYGDGSNRTFYSAIDYLGHPRADYFPDLYEVTVGDTNTPLTGLIRHYTKMIAFKPLETFSIDYGVVTLADGLMTPAFYVTPVNKNAGNQAVGQVQLVLNAPRSLCQGNLYEWRNGSARSANLSIDERQAKRISDRIYDTLRKMDFTKVHCYDDNLNTEYYIVDDDGNALVHNYFCDAWYYYTGIDARVLLAVDGVLYVGTKSGKIFFLDESKPSDNGKPIDCYWESGSMDFGSPNMRKYSSQLWVSVKSENKNAITVTALTDRSDDNAEVDVEPEYEFDIPKITKLKIKTKKFVFYKLVFKSKNSTSKVTVVDTTIKVRVTSQAK